MRVRAAAAAIALGTTLVTGAATIDAAGAPAGPAGARVPATARQCPAKEIKKVWYGGTSTRCPNLRDELDHLFYPGHRFTTALAHTYREKVVFLQLRLHDLGYSGIVADGFYGAQTHRIVKSYQRRHHLVVDGTVGLQTWKSLFHLGRA